MPTTTYTAARIEADPTLPIIRITRDFVANPRAAAPGAHRSGAVRPLGRTAQPADPD
jgi:hypothetical protein